MRKFAPLLVIVLLFGACGDDSGGGGSSDSAFCDRAKEFADLTEQLASDPSGVPQLAKAIDDLAGDAPNEIKDEIKTLNEAFQAVAKAVEGVEDQQAIVSAIITALGKFDQEKLQADQTAVLEFVEKECGVTLNTTSTTGAGAGADDPAVSTDSSDVQNNDG